MRSKFLLYFNTVRYLKPVQIYGRIYSKLKRPFTRYNLPELKSEPSGISKKNNFINHDPWNHAEDIASNKFTFLSRSHAFGSKINWQDKSLSLLWLFNLHYFAYLFLLNKSARNKIIFDWIASNPIESYPGWHSYPLSLRIVNWIKSDIDSATINKSLFRQCAFLYRNLEYYHPANHYLENAKALIFGGAYFYNLKVGRKWLRKGLNIYKKFLPRMVLDDGSFFELSPMYHLIMFESLLDVLNILDKKLEEYYFFESYASNMLTHLNQVTHPDGDIALFNDSTIEIAPKPIHLMDYASLLNINFNKTNNASQIFSYRNNDLYFIIKSSEIGPDNIPAHSHSDIFTYELSYKGKRFIVDSGNYSYEKDEMRNYCRSTAAHNTVSIDNNNQAEVWNTFRVARRYKAKDVNFKKELNGFTFSGIFEGYSKIIGDKLIHRRNINAVSASSEITFSDEILGKRDHKVESYIHLHPDVVINKNGDYLHLSVKEIKIKLFIPNSELTIKEGWYCPMYGTKLRNKVVSLYSDKVPAKLIYHIYPE